MVAHGYGMAEVGMPNLIFSNVVWGYLVRTIPQINGVFGYSIATISVLIIVGTTILHTLRKLEFGWQVSLPLVILLLVRPVLFPQFTINAGLLTVGAIVCWHLYGKQGNRIALLAGCLLAFCGYLVRSHEFFLVLLIALPLLPWTKLVRDRIAQASVLALLLAISSAVFVDYQAYQGDDWQAFNTLNSARTPITDFGAHAQLKKHPEILARHGYSANDIDLIRSWFFVDSKIANPMSLNAMLLELGPFPDQSHALINGWVGIKALVNPILLPFFLAALSLLVLLPSRKLFATWVLCLAAFFALGILGRPGILRVYIPVLSLLLIVPLLGQALLSSKDRRGVRGGLHQCLVQGVIVVAALFNTTTVFSESRAAQVVSDQVRENLQGLPEETVVNWGDTFPFEAVYPVLKQSNVAMAYKIYSLGVFTLAPFSTAYAEENAGNGMLDRLNSKSGIPILAAEYHFNLLEIYCSEHLDSNLYKIATKNMVESIFIYRCAPMAPQ